MMFISNFHEVYILACGWLPLSILSFDMTPWNPWSCSHVSVNMIHGVVHVSSGMSIIADLASLDVCTIYCIPETGTDLYVV